MRNGILVFILFTLIQNLFASPCTFNEKREYLECANEEYKIDGLYDQRSFLVAKPSTPPPRLGYPAVLFFQGSFFPISFRRNVSDPFNGYNEILVIKELLNNGYMVIAPKAMVGLFWQTNFPTPDYRLSSDYFFLNELFSFMKNNLPVNMNNLFATGISSGGYMSDRMVHSHDDIQFKAIAIASASHATCSGPLCIMPDEVKDNHPPTLFLHGKRDIVVPVRTAKKYERFLKANGVKTKMVIDPKGTHEWIDPAPKEILKWFNLFKSSQ